MKTIPITILAEDIMTSEFHQFNDCAITRAVKRAGIQGYHSGFDSIVDFQGNAIGTLESKQISQRVIGMYYHKHPECHHLINPEDMEEPANISTFITLTEAS